MSLADSQRTFGVKRKTLRALKINYLQGFVVPRAGIEPARIAPLVFETSASTDSAIWALCLGSVGLLLTVTEVVDLLVEGCKGMVKFVNMQYVSIGVVINCYKFASAYLQGRVRIPIGGIVREPKGMNR